MNTRVLLISAALFVGGCTNTGAADEAAPVATTEVSPTTSGVVGDVEADELPLPDGDDVLRESGDEAPLTTPQLSASDDSVSQGDLNETVSAGTQDDDEEAEDLALAFVDALTSCAIVEAGFIAALDGDASAAELYERGSQAAVDSGSPAYTSLGHQLKAALGAPNVDQEADSLLAQCQIDGFERLAG